MTRQILFILLFLFILPKNVFAHPQDQVYWDVTIQNNRITETKIYLSWQEASYIVEKYGTSLQAETLRNSGSGPDAFAMHLKTLHEFSDVYLSYIRNNIEVFNNDIACQIDLNDSIVTDVTSALVGKGIEIVGNIRCDKPVGRLTFSSTLLQKDFPYQTTVLHTVIDGVSDQHIVSKDNNTFILDMQKYIQKEPELIITHSKTPVFVFALGLLLIIFAIIFK